MSERLLSTIEWTPRHENALQIIGPLALNLMRHRYGDGQAGGEGGFDRRLTFHHLSHARMVGEKALQLCRYMDLSITEQKTAELAGYAHDVLQLHGVGVNETKSADWLIEQLDTFGVPELSGAAMMAILGTQPRFQNGVLTHQKVHEYTLNEDAALIRAVPSADLSSLYTPAGPRESHALFAEMQGKAPGEVVPLDGILQFQESQLALLEGYRYPLRQAETLFATHRSEVLTHQTRVLRTIEAGNFDTFDQIVTADQAFERAHS